MNLFVNIYRNPFYPRFYYVVFRDDAPVAVFDDVQSLSVYLTSLESEVVDG